MIGSFGAQDERPFVRKAPLPLQLVAPVLYVCFHQEWYCGDTSRTWELGEKPPAYYTVLCFRNV